MNELALFAGAGGGILGGKLLGWRTVCAVEWEPYPASVLCARQNDGLLPPFPIWDDVQTFDGKPWRGIVDVVSGGFPCQDISAAGGGMGITGSRSGMWKHMARIIGEVRPQYVFVENSPMLTTRGLGVVLADLSTMGFDAKWGVVSAADIGANHQRERIWIRAEQRNLLSHTEHNGIGRRQQQSESVKETVDMANANFKQSGSLEGGRSNINGGKECNYLQRIFDVDARGLQKQTEQILANTNEYGTQSQSSNTGKPSEWIDSSGIGNRNWWAIEPNVGRVSYVVAARVDRLKAIGNGQVPLCAATAWRILGGEL